MPNFEGYENLEKIAEGKDRTVYSALRVADRTPVILKTLRSQQPSIDMIALMYHEYEIAKDINYAGIIRTYDLIDQQNHYAIVQENMSGISLQQYFQENFLTDITLFLKLAIQMTKIIGHLHQLHIIHKDIKPSNFIINPKTLTLKLTDFNFSSKLMHETQDIVPPNKLEGTLAYMAPEQTGRVNMRIDYRADFYALGISFYEILSGNKLPYTHTDPLELLHAHLASPIPSVNNPEIEIPIMLVELIKKLMAKNPNDRYQSAMGLEVDLEHCLESLEVTGRIDQFTLGQQDILDHLNLSQNLYGRENEIQSLLNAYERVSQGSVEALMVCGYSGIGKTMLINEVHKPMVQHQGYFVRGKFDQLQRDKPYTAITEAFNQLARLILAEPEARFEKIKKSIQEAMGSVGQVMIDLAPDLELIIGPQPQLELLQPKETENRMMIFFKKFLHIIASKEHPLVMFIDDLQWIDSGSLSLLEEMMTDTEMTHLLLIGAYRENEVDHNHPFKKFILRLEEQRVKIQSLPLSPLSVVNFTHFFQDSLHRDEATVSAFAELVHTRTKGNPFFCKQVLNLLYRDRLLFFNYDRRHWEWDIAKISTLSITDNVVDLMLDKLAELPENTQKLLQYASCIGNQFKIDMLMMISGQSGSQIGSGLWPALQQELLITPSLGYKRVDAVHNENLAEKLTKNIIYQFVHDRVQQAAYQSITKEHKAQIHLNIARILVEREPDASKNERLFEVADHFNQAHALLTKEEKMEVANLNYLAGLRAKNANAYRPMLNYLSSAMKLMDATTWESDYRFAFDLNRNYLLALYLLSQFEEAEKLNRKLIKRANNNLDKSRIYQIKIMMAIGQEDRMEIFSIAKKALSLLGVNINLKPNPILLILKYYKVRWKMRRFDSNTAENLPKLTNPEIEAALDILIELWFLLYEKDVKTLLYANLLAIELMLQYGKSRATCVWLMGYAFFILYLSRDIEKLFKYSDIAEKMFLENPDKYTGCQYHQFKCTPAIWRGEVNAAAEINEKAKQESLESGNLTGYFLCMGSQTFIEEIKARSLNKTVDEATAMYKYSSNKKMDDISAMFEVIAYVYHNLGIGSTEENDRFLHLKSIICSSDSFIVAGNGQKHLSFYYYFQEEFEKSIEFHFNWYEYNKNVEYEYFVIEIKMLNSLTLMRELKNVSFKNKLRYRRRIKEMMRDVAWAAKSGPKVLLHHYLFLQAFQDQLNQHYFDALIKFNKAIENAKRSDYILWVALGYELIGELFIERGLYNMAIYYFRDARYYYDRYGMQAKVTLLEKHYPECAIEGKNMISDSQSLGLSTSTTSAATSASLDFMSIIKASQAISGEIVLGKLFEKMLHVLLESAGATKAILLESRRNVWQKTASLVITDGHEEFQMLQENLTEYHDLPQTVVQYAIRLREPVVLHSSTEDDKFKQDPYIVSTQPKSILCLPIVQQDMILGTIYLENNLTENAFTEDRVTVLKTLAAQIAISIQNSHYLEHMENLYHSTERFIPKKFLEIIKRENIEEVDLGDSAKREITVLFNDIRSFTTLVENRSPEEAFAFINRYWKFMAPIIRKYDGYIDHYQGDAILAIFSNKPQDAVLAAISMMKALGDFNDAQAQHHDVSISMGIGISTGPAMLGIIGEEERQVSGLISDVANTAARVEGLNTTYGSRILLSDATADDLPLNLKSHFRKVDKVRLKGKSQITVIYEYIEWEDALKIPLTEYLDMFSKAFNNYESGNFKEAEHLFAECLSSYENDKAAQALLQRCQEFINTKVPDDWDGAYTLTRK
jgi:predicted ATPase/class 3 adenylate cyclase/GAF domain-containing protein